MRYICIDCDTLKRYGHVEGHTLVDPDLKPDLLQNQIKAVVMGLETKLKGTNRKLRVFWGKVK